jgi:hypothetical protein
MDGAYRATVRERCRSKPVPGRPYWPDLIQPTVIRRIAEASNVLSAASAFLEAVAGLLRQLLHVAGWCCLSAPPNSSSARIRLLPTSLCWGWCTGCLAGLIKP